MTSFPSNTIRRQFPALQRDENFVFFDNAAGAQIPQVVLDAVDDHLVSRNVQRGGRYSKSCEVDAMIAHARQTVALFLNARYADEVAFGMNATSFLRIVSLAVGDDLNERPEIIVSDMDHEANIAVWLALERFGAVIRWWRIRDDGRLHVEDLDPLLNAKTRLVACAVASNAIGSLVDVSEVARRAHAVGSELLLDAVHYGPHGLFDVRTWDCDYLVCSGYKIFAPHMGFLWGKREALENLRTFREDFIPDVAPGKIEAGTFVYENVAGMEAAIRYLQTLDPAPDSSNGRGAIVRAMQAVREYETDLSRSFLDRLCRMPRVTLYGIADSEMVCHRVPTFCFNVQGVAPAEVSTRAAEQGFGVRDGHMYSPRLMNRLGLAKETGAVRVSLVHYNTEAEIHRFADALGEF